MATATALNSTKAASIQEFRRARASRRFEDVLEIGDALLDRDPQNQAVYRALARTLNELRRRDEALTHWLALVKIDPDDVEAVYQVARHAIAEGATAEAAVRDAAPRGSPISARHLVQALGLEPAPVGDADALKHIAICGVSFCGSTLLDRVLGGLPGARSIGESHWLCKEHDGNAYVPMMLSVPRSGRGPFCSVCGRGCQALTLDFRLSLVMDPSNWYQKIAYRLQTATLLSADKNLPKLIDNDPLLRMTGFVVFKSPEQAWASNLSKMPPNQSEQFQRSALEKYVNTWTVAYEGFLDDFDPVGGAVYLCFDEFAATPMAGLQCLTEKLGLEFDPTVLSETRPGHAIGGNAAANTSLRSSNFKVKVEPLPSPAVPEAHLTWLKAQRPMQEVFERLQARRIRF